MKSGEVFLCTSFSLQSTYGQELELICLACQRSQCWSSSSTPCRSQVHGRNLQLHADENDSGRDPIYMQMQMLMKCLCNALGMLMHACNLVGGPPQCFVYFHLHWVITLALDKGLHAAEARPVQNAGCWAGANSRALWVELAEMLNIP